MSQIIAELEPLFIERGLNLPLESLLHACSEKAAQRNSLAFLNYLFALNLLQETDYQEILAEVSVELTSLNVLDPFYDQTQLIDQRQEISPSQLVKNMHNQSGQNFLLLKQIGAGAMGSIHLAKDRFLRRQVAFKKLLPGMDSAEVVERFFSEVQITAQLDHPNVIPIYTLDSDEYGAPAYSMKVIKGISMKAWLAQIRQAYHLGQVPDEYSLSDRLEVFLKICDALMLAHQRGIIHRDLKPANIMLGEYNEVYVMDWGIARTFKLDSDAAEQSSERVRLDSTHYLESEANQIVGTPRYMSPEQAGGKNEILDQRSDIFAMGLILFEVLCLKQALVAKTMPEMLTRVIRGQFEHFESAFGEVLSPALKAIVFKANQRRRIDRYQNIGDLAEDIRRYLREEPVLVHQESLLFKAQRLIHRYRQQVVLSMLGSVFLGVTLTSGVLYYKQISLQAAEERRIVLGRIQSELANQGQIMTAQLLKQEALLNELSGSSRVALQAGLPAQAPPNFVIRTGQQTDVPDDYALYPGFGEARSFQEPSFIEPTTQSAHVDLLKLAPLKTEFQTLLLSSKSPQSIAIPQSERETLLRSPELPIERFFLTLPSGLHIRYPGQIPAGSYEALKDPLYQAARKSRLMVWSASEVQATNLSCTVGMYSIQGEFLGLAGLKIKRKETLKPFLNLPGQSEVTELFLVNAKAEVLEVNPDSALMSAREQADLQKAFNQASGYLIEQGQLLAYTRLGRGDLYLVLKAKLNQLL